MKRILILLLSLSSILSSAQTMENLFELTVAQDGSGNFKTIQEAINNVRDHAEIRVTIIIKPGIYNEKVVIPFFKRNITLKGLDKEKTLITYNDYSGKPFRGIDITGNPKFSTYTSYTLLVQGNDCSVENLTIENTAGKVGQAVALHTEGDRLVFKNCSILGNQDTLYLAKGGTRNYFENCYINGTTDFIFGAATVYFYNCTIESLTNSYVTAASTTQQDAHGFVFVDCKLTAKDTSVNKVFLGRPWRPYAQTVFINTEMGSHILAEGWNPWKGDKNFPDKEKTVFYAEHGSKGEGGKDTSKRVAWSHQLKKADLKKYDLGKVFNGWNPKN
ncbi:pectinesterase family protein [Flavobacterium eburneipallidum]|uniref:pectinesterase family protein n=1 Tax=Flavobacterium eburneipallidum TaxID=3003263 RepID=UPI0022ABC755|nr:pectinesterase family protein [Flavobacterium eburneipallidum]